MRETETRAKHSGQPRTAAKVVPHPDQQAALTRAEDALERALGTGVHVRSTRRGLRAEIQFGDLDELLEFARAAAEGRRPRGWDCLGPSVSDGR